MNHDSLDPLVLKRVLKESGLSYTENSRSYIFTCPKCDKAKKLYIRKSDGRFVCFFCKELHGFHGRAEYGLSALLNVPVKDIVAVLYEGRVVHEGDAYLEMDELRDFFEDEDQEEVSHELVQWPIETYTMDDPKAARGLEYLKGRGIPQSIAMQYGLRYYPEQRRVMFPVQSGPHLFGWQARLVIPHIWYDQEGNQREIPKILTSKGLRREHVLMFGDRLIGSDHAILCEGPVDGIKAHYCGGNVVTMGKAVSPTQVSLLKRVGVRRIYLALDPDAAEETERLVRDLGDLELYDMTATGAKDLGEMSFEEVYELFLSCSPISASRVFVFLK